MLLLCKTLAPLHAQSSQVSFKILALYRQNSYLHYILNLMGPIILFIWIILASWTPLGGKVLWWRNCSFLSQTLAQHKVNLTWPNNFFDRNYLVSGDCSKYLQYSCQKLGIESWFYFTSALCFTDYVFIISSDFLLYNMQLQKTVQELLGELNIL